MSEPSISSGLPFLKMHGLGNDVVVLDARKHAFTLTPANAKAIADRRTGIGCDQIMIIEAPRNGGDAYVAIRNSDGGVLHEEHCMRIADIPLSDGVGVNVGNPHAVFFVKDAAAIDLETVGPKLEHHALFPARINVEAVQVLDRGHLRMRVWERGAGITRACGTGACASAVAAARRGLTDRKVTVTLDGGDLRIEWRDDGHVIMTGPATLAFSGLLDRSLLS